MNIARLFSYLFVFVVLGVFLLPGSQLLANDRPPILETGDYADAPRSLGFFVDEFDGSVLATSRWIIIKGTPILGGGWLALADDTDIQSVPAVFTGGMLRGVIRSSDWKPHGTFTDTSVGFEIWSGGNGKCHSGVVFKPSGHLGILRPQPDEDGNCDEDPENQAYTTISNWDEIRAGDGAIWFELSWRPDLVSLEVRGNEQVGEASLTGDAIPQDSLRIRLYVQPGESFEFDYIQFVSFAALASPQLRSPNDRKPIGDTAPVFAWTRPRGATQFWLQVSSDSSFNTADINLATGGPVYVVPDVNALPFGVYYWRTAAGDATGNWSDWSSVYQFTLTLLRTPRNADHVTTGTPRFVWTPVRGATQYHLQVDDADDFTSPVYEYTGPASWSIPTPALGYGQYWWRVQVEAGGTWSNYTPAWTITVTPPPPGRPTLITPTNRANLDTPTPTFEWDDPSECHVYQLQVDDRGNFLEPELDVTLDPGVLTYTSPDSLPDGGRYFWRVRCLNEYDMAGSWSARWLFTLNQLSRPTLLAPRNGTLTGDDTPTFEWKAVTGAASYQIEVDDDVRFGSPDVTGEPTGTTYTSTGLEDSRWFWRARAVDTNGIPGLWSSVWFVTVDTTGPDAPTPRSPADRGGTPDMTPALVWRPARSAVEYQVQFDPVDDAEMCYEHDFAAPQIDELVNRPIYIVPEADALDYGVYCWRVKGKDRVDNWGEWSDPRAFYVTIMRAPRDTFASVNQRPVFVWLTVRGAVEYEFELDDDPNFASPDETYTGLARSYRPVDPLDYGTYYWHVRFDDSGGYGDWMPTWAVTSTPRPPARPRQDAPRPNTLLNDSTPTVSWLAAVGAYTYQVQIDDDAAFGSPDQDYVTGVGELSYTATELADGRWYWRVRALNEVEAPGPWSARWFFAVDTLSPDVPTPTSPADGSSVTNRMLRLMWDRVPGASGYELQLDTNPAFPLPPIDVGPRTVYKPPTPLSRGVYHWCVRSVDRAGNVSAWSEVRSFELVAGVTLLPDGTETDEPMPARVEAETKWVQMTGIWSAEETVAASGGKYLISSGRDVDDVLALTFEGNQITVVFIKDPAYGRLGIEIDGELVRTVECSDVTGRTFGTQVTVGGLAPGQHTIRVFPVVGRVGVDAFLVE
ncbi:MAG: hypothetical protein JW966_11205 [Anaerolineae bacterium]|nr:hypothetical protein [Anaerolineae bacterium]